MKFRPLKINSREGWHLQLNILTNVIMFKSSFAKSSKGSTSLEDGSTSAKTDGETKPGMFFIPKLLLQLSMCLFHSLLYFQESISTLPLCRSPSCEIVSCSHREQVFPNCPHLQNSLFLKSCH